MKKRADGRYCKQILIGYHPDGRRKLKNIYGGTIREVEKKERTLREKIDNRELIDADKMNFSEWADNWLKTYKRDNVTYNTYKMYKNAVETHLVPVIGDIPLKNIKTVQLQQILNEIVNEGNTRSAEICKLTLCQIFKQALYNRIVPYDITVGLQQIKRRKTEKRPLTEFERASIKIAPLNVRQRTFIDIMRYMGLRRGETLALTKSDVDLQAMKLSVNKSLAFVENNYEIKEPKTEKSKRVLPIPQIVKEELRDYLGSLKGKILFPASNGEYMTRSSFRKFWEGIIKTVEGSSTLLANNNGKFKDCTISFTPHIFRHTYATDIYYSGIDIKTAQYLLGHSSINVTLDIYTHLDKEKMEDAAEKLNKFLCSN